jgi:predicted transposase/invertase (TIGR01784 family)
MNSLFSTFGFLKQKRKLTMERVIPNDERFISFTSDYGFKVTFGNELNMIFLKKALQILIGSDIPIKEIYFKNTAFNALTIEDRQGIFDLFCQDEKDNLFIVEMQLQATLAFLNRLKFYNILALNSLIGKGKFDFKITNKIYCIAFLGTDIFPFENCKNVLTLKNQDGLLADDQTTYITIELNKFNLKAEDIKTDFDKLIYTIKYDRLMENTATRPAFMEEEWLKSAFDELDLRAMTPEKYSAYMMYKMRLDENERIKEELMRESEERGEERGEKRGEKRGEIMGAIKFTDWNDTKIAENLKVEVKLVKQIRKELNKENG